MTMSSGSPISSSWPVSGPPSRESPIAGSARLPTITGWTNSTVTWRTSERAPGDTPTATRRPPRAKRSAIRWQSRASESASAAKNLRLATLRAAIISPRRSAAPTDAASIAA